MANYLQMWKDLGMDIENHDNLCAVLPTAFGDTYLSQENRPAAMDFWDMVVADIHGIRPAELIEEQKKGRKVFGTFCVYVPDEVVLAADGIVTGLCGGSQFWVPDGEAVLPKSTCPLIKASVGARLGKTCPFFRIADMYVGETTCDGKKKAWEILGKDVPMHIMDMPQMKRPKDYDKWVEEIKEFAKVVEELTGNEITRDKLENAIKIINAKRKAIERVYQARKADKLPISGKDVLLMTQIAFFDDPERCATMCNKLADELEQRIKDGVSVFPEGTKRIMVSGTPMAIPNWKLHHIIETSGAAVVCEETCTGTRYFENLVEEGKTTLEEQYRAIAERYMGINCACFTPNTGRIDDIIRLAKEYKVDGVIDVNLKFCCLYDTEGKSVEEALKENGIPVLGIETDYTDSDAQQLRTRIEAFVEMLG
ncbi:double-cubane-cluster-containing anaerobic reductase [Eubacterium oxidoreducens]|uniref:Benzoyl-CoA reductase/2-hydroxyglutaryl-CoA dehydratase subunit, BcrC/BadD/HgdB n=1 Tax=Eubacterium oxidoreducens TaxID=1732 RepID=A0A1G6BFT9_EUBOX|nr:double-cubane-cluster-containing anaerobic reductase [Eubacterium oxidoreducens]SDB19481.1 Benzoyl-CoA reductase/2-hydroxyglutaryl-CoA dehydratase subunit, BcrC/BadD/HgdB [Eubacterium oxidoreducens]